MLDHDEHGLDDGVLPRGARHGSRGFPGRVVPADGARRRADGVALHGHRRRVRSHDVPRPRAGRVVPRADPAAVLLRGAARLGEGARGVARRGRRRSREGRAIRSGARDRLADVGGQRARRSGTGCVRGSLGARRARVAGRPRPDRARPVRDRDDGCRADPVRDPAVLPQPRRAALGGVRPVGDERPDDVDAVPREGRHGRPRRCRASRWCSTRTARC